MIKNKKSLVIFVIATFTILFIMPIENSVSKQEENFEIQSSNTFTVLIGSDWHVGEGNGDYDTRLWVNNSDEYYDWDIAICAGDIVHGPGADTISSQLVSMWDILDTSEHQREDFYMTAGNHEAKLNDDAGNMTAWDKIADQMGFNGYINNDNRPFPIINRCTGDANESNNRTYAFEFGNVLVLMICPDYEGSGTDFSDSYTWWNWYVEEYKDTHNIISVLHQHPSAVEGDTEGKISGTGGSGTTSYTNYLDDYATNHHTVNLWLSGDHHYILTSLPEWKLSNITDNIYNVTFFNGASIVQQNTGTEERSHTYLMTFTNGSTTVQVGDFFNGNDTAPVPYTGTWGPQWTPNGGANNPTYGNPGNFTFELSYAFDYMGEDENISQFISIENSVNGTTIYNSTPTINWTLISNTSQYWLQIDNNADFSSPEINYTDINQYTYPDNCDINSTRISFTLPTDLPSYSKYYMRVKALTKQN